MNYIDQKYIGLVSPRLEQFKRKTPTLYNFRCPLCGDSERDKSKARGYLFEVKGDILYKCHNCGASLNFRSFIEQVDPNLKREYVTERFKSKHIKKETTLDRYNSIKKKVHFAVDPMKGATRLDKLDDDHIAVQYVKNRKIPVDKWKLLYYTSKFKHFVNTIVPDKFDNEKNDEARLLIPFFNSKNELFALQGRSFKIDTRLRYITIKIDEDQAKIYGQERISTNMRKYIVEGPIDSLFVENCMAMAGSDIPAVKNLVVVYDNENRNREIIKKMLSAIDNGYEIVVWPDYIKEKDINDMILSGMTQNDVMSVLNNNTYSGLQAKVRINQWKKV